MLKAVLAAVIVYLLADAGFDFILKPLGFEYLHAFLAMYCGMLVGGFLAPRSFIWVALTLNLLLSALTYTLVARMRQQSPVELILEQHLMVSVGSFVGAFLGAWMGNKLAKDRADMLKKLQQ